MPGRRPIYENISEGEYHRNVAIRGDDEEKLVIGIVVISILVVRRLSRRKYQCSYLYRTGKVALGSVKVDNSSNQGLGILLPPSVTIAHWPVVKIEQGQKRDDGDGTLHHE